MGRAGHGLYLIFFMIESRVATPLLMAATGAAISSYVHGPVVNRESVVLFLLSGVLVPLAALLLAVFGLVCDSWGHDAGTADWSEFIDVKDESLARKYAGMKIPIETVTEAYMAGKIDMKQDFYEVFLHRNQLFRFCFTWSIIKFYVGTFIGQNFSHGETADHGEIAHVYNRGNDFYNWFLGPTMIYTSGIFVDEDESLEDAQHRKLDLVCQYTGMEKGDDHLDIGCGWGTLVAHAAKYYGTNSYGVTLAQAQADWAAGTIAEYGVKKNVTLWVMDYRQIPERKFNVITCLEMAEHVGIKNFQNFLHQVKGMLHDDGSFYLQIAGLRRAWQYEDLVWGVFMAKYIFPAADASCPLGFVSTQLERAGFEIHRVENTGIHYSLTIRRWYDNWMSNEDAVVAKYGQWWFRLWVVFLAWSSIIAAQGSSTVFMITCHINHKNDERSVKGEDAPICRMGRYVGPSPIGTQQ